jgi:hypothetical protein
MEKFATEESTYLAHAEVAKWVLRWNANIFPSKQLFVAAKACSPVSFGASLYD